MGRVIAVLVGTGKSLQLGERTVTTGIDKRPVPEAVVSAAGVHGDTVSDTEHHGGPDQAVYAYFAEDYAWWAERLGPDGDLRPGRFGENVVLEGFDSAGVRIGDRFATDRVELQVTAPRIPCGVLAAHMDDAGFVKRFVGARRPGFYARVLREGTLRAGDAVRHVASEGPLLVDMYDEWYAKPHDPERLREMLASPLATRMREAMERWLEALAATDS